MSVIAVYAPQIATDGELMQGVDLKIIHTESKPQGDATSFVSYRMQIEVPATLYQNTWAELWLHLKNVLKSKPLARKYTASMFIK